MNTRITLSALLVLTLLGCDSRNPEQIAAERAGRPTPTIAPRRQAANQQPQHRQVAPSRARPTLKPARILNHNPKPMPGKAQPLNLMRLVREGQVACTCNDQQFKGSLPALFNGEVDNPIRSASVNPVLIEFTFKEPIELSAVRLYPSYSSYDWAVYTSNDQDAKGLMIQNAPSEEWSRMDLPKTVKTDFVRVEILRKLRDDYVHANELEFYVE